MAGGMGPAACLTSKLPSPFSATSVATSLGPSPCATIGASPATCKQGYPWLGLSYQSPSRHTQREFYLFRQTSTV